MNRHVRSDLQTLVRSNMTAGPASPSGLNDSQKRLYSQIHPAKLVTDISMSILTLYLFWLHNFVPALLLHILPGVVVSYLIIRLANLEKYARSELGRYLAKYMTTRMQITPPVGRYCHSSGRLVSNVLGNRSRTDRCHARLDARAHFSLSHDTKLVKWTA